ncbi:hypothetical protein PSPO01_06986 [Paraphaeosphaeria sporulosa]
MMPGLQMPKEKSLVTASNPRRTLARRLCAPGRRLLQCSRDVRGRCTSRTALRPPSDVPIVCCCTTCTSPQHAAALCKGIQPCGQHILSSGSLAHLFAFGGHIFRGRTRSKGATHRKGSALRAPQATDKSWVNVSTSFTSTTAATLL